MLAPQEFIRLARDRVPLPPEKLREFIEDIAKGDISDAHIAAFCMAVFLNGLSTHETANLTRAMAQSGIVLQWGDLSSRVIDKHSTGGVGDKISLMLAPMVAACGLYVPMIAGRGLGHAGGTIDKLEAIPGYNTALPLDQFQKQVRELGCSIIGQTKELAPADRRMYAVRDVTGSVESVHLITASILSKKLAAGLSGLVLDVKCGNGAYMQTIDRAREQASTLKAVATAAGLPLTPIITDMNQVLGYNVGNATEIVEAIDYLTGTRREPRMHTITMALCAEMLVMGKIANTHDDAHRMLQQNLDNGRATEIFAKMIAAQGGPNDLIDNYKTSLCRAPVIRKIIADRNGTLTAMHSRDIAITLIKLKAGRSSVGDTIDPVIGLTDMAPLGTACIAGETILAELHLRNESDADWAQCELLGHLTINDNDVTPSSLILN